MVGMLRGWMICAIIFLACTSAVQAQPHDKLVVGLGSFPAEMNPFIGSPTIRNYVLAVSRRSVTRYGGDGKPMCQLCTELPSVENGRVKTTELPSGGTGMDVTFTLRSGLRWGDGTPLTTKDILLGAELEHTFNPRANIIGVVAVDDHSFTVKLSAPRYDFTRLSPQPVNAAIEEPILRAAKDPLDYGSKSAFNRAPATPGLWNGPYLMTAFKPGESVSFAPNPYWDGEKPGFQQVTMRLIDNSAALLANLLSGDVDTVNGLSFDQVLDVQKRYADRFDVSFVPGFATFWLYLQNENPILADKRVRQAMILAIDRQAIVDRVFGGKLPIAHSIFPEGDPNYDHDLKPWPYDPARSRALLAEAGYTAGPDGVMVRADGTRLSIDILVTAGIRTSELLQQVVQSQFRQVGIETIAKSEPDRVLYGSSARKRLFKGILMMTDNMSPDVVPASSYATSGIPREGNLFSGDNFSGYSNPHVDTLLKSALTELEPAKRHAMLDDVQAIIMDELPLIPIYNRSSFFVSPRWMMGMLPPRSTYVATLWIEYWKPK